MNPTPKIQPVVLGLIEKDGKYLMTKRIDEHPEHHNQWQIPGGGLEFGEHPLEAMNRELREELGVSVKNLQMIPFVDTSIRENWQGLFLLFHGQLVDDEKNIRLNEEASEWGWFNLEEIKQLEVLKGCIEAVTATYGYIQMKGSKTDSDLI